MKLAILIVTLVSLLHANGVEDAKTYHNNSSVQSQVALETIDLIPWQGTERVLDIGSGDGKITTLLAKRAGLVLGIDVSQAMIDFASSHYGQTEYPNLAFLKMDGAELAFEARFDRVVSFSSLHWILDQEKVLKATYRALVPEGRICFHIYGVNLMNITEIGTLLARSEKWAPYFPAYKQERVFFTEEGYRDLLEQAGFEDIEINGSWRETIFAHRQAMADFARPLLNWIYHLPLELQREFVEEVVDGIVSLGGLTEKGEICYRTFNLQVVATKKENL
jgi:trans-aconitate methyltransferase